jgi:hypothetical protein
MVILTCELETRKGREDSHLKEEQPKDDKINV